MTKRVLIIKLGALGDVILASGAVQTIINHYGAEHCDILTDNSYANIFRDMTSARVVAIDRNERLKIPNLAQNLRHYDIIFDLQDGSFTRILHKFLKLIGYNGQFFSENGFNDSKNSIFSKILFFLLKKIKYKGQFWSKLGLIDPNLPALQRTELLCQKAGLADIINPHTNFWQNPSRVFDRPEKYALICVGSSPEHPQKRYPIDKYGKICQYLHDNGVTPVIIGGGDEIPLGKICNEKYHALDLTGQTQYGDIAILARHAQLAVGNDTGPMHIITASGCKAIWLFSPFSDPVKSQPSGPFTIVTFDNNSIEQACQKVQDNIHKYLQGQANHNP